MQRRTMLHSCWISVEQKIDGYGSQPRSAGCSPPTHAPKILASPNIPMQMSANAVPMSTEWFSLEVRFGRQDQGFDRALRGRGPTCAPDCLCKGLCRTAEKVEQGGETKRPATRPDCTSCKMCNMLCPSSKSLQVNPRSC